MPDTVNTITGAAYQGRAGGVWVHYDSAEIMGRVCHRANQSCPKRATMVAFKVVCQHAIDERQAGGIVQLFLTGCPYPALLRYVGELS